MMEAERRRAANRAVLVGLILVAVVAGGFLISQWMQPPTQPEADVGRGVVEAFLALVRDGRPGEAWDSATAEFKSIEGRESFIRTAAKAPILKEELAFNSTQEVKVQDQPRTEYLFQSPEAKMVRVLVGYEGGDWKVDRLSF